MVESIFDHSQTNIYRKRLKFYSNAAQVFRLLHGIRSTRTITVKQLKLLNSSSNLDSFVNVYTALLHDYYDSIKYDEGTAATKERLSYQKVTVVWKLLQILFFSGFKKGSNHCYSTNLMTWMNFFDKRGILQFDIQGVFNSDIPTSHTLFWPLTYKLILRGEVKPLQQLFEVALERVSDPYDKTILKTLTKLIQSFPKWTQTNNNNNMMDDGIDTGDNSDDEQKIAGERNIWRKQAMDGLQQIHIFRTSRPHLVNRATEAINMLCGNIPSLCKEATSSIEAIIASIYYYNHDSDETTITNNNSNNNNHSFKSMTIRKINTLAQHVADIKSSSSSTTTTEKNEQDQHEGLLALLKGNIYQAMEQCADLDWWLLAHMSDILDRYTLQRQQNVFDGDDDSTSAGIFGGEPLYLHISGRQQASKMESRVYFLLSYAHILVVQDDMWQTAFDYMGTCGILGRSEISQTISKIPMTDNNVALEVASYCTRNGLIGQRQNIYEKMATQLDQQQCYSAAIRYYCLAGKYERLEGVFENVFLRYCQNRQLESFDDLDDRYKAECGGPLARFYFGFYDFQTMYKEGKISNARKVVIDLLLSDVSPRHFLPILFVESITVMEVCQDVLTGEVASQLDQCLNRVVTSENKEGVQLLRTYIGQVDDDDDDGNRITASLVDIYKLILDRLSK